jgi:hypothetical protein
MRDDEAQDWEADQRRGDAPLHQWVGTVERYWQHQLNRVEELAAATVRNGAPGLNPQNQNPDPKS